ncbi:syndecan-2 [Cololabis saira]|uniref:syndecan-2 n=1 Tax=Cololabis saira TaxID=129043 RepID=UPI002AD46DDD|nr:syndecan-2 [Cololabis saira]
MRRAWMIVALSVLLCGDTIAEAASSPADDLYLDTAASGGYYPEDDDDFTSGSGSGGREEELEDAVTVGVAYTEVSAAQPTLDSTKASTPKMDTATVRVKTRERKPVRTEPPVPVTEGPQRNQLTSTTAGPSFPQESVEVQTENLFQRTEVLAAVIAGGVIGFLFAIFLILLLIYRMRKKDEGSYDLGERKPTGAAYQKAPTKEFYA